MNPISTVSSKNGDFLFHIDQGVPLDIKILKEQINHLNTKTDNLTSRVKQLEKNYSQTQAKLDGVSVKINTINATMCFYFVAAVAFMYQIAMLFCYVYMKKIIPVILLNKP